MEPLITKTDTYSYGFYRKLIENIKQTKDVQDPDSEEANHVRRAVVWHCVRGGGDIYAYL